MQPTPACFAIAIQEKPQMTAATEGTICVRANLIASTDVRGAFIVIWWVRYVSVTDHAWGPNGFMLANFFFFAFFNLVDRVECEIHENAKEKKNQPILK